MVDNHTLPIYICEDIPERLMQLKEIAETQINTEDLSMEVVCASSDPYSLLDYLKDHPQNALYFLDIDLKVDMDGFELAQEIRKIDNDAFIVIITTHDELSIMAFEYEIEAMDYIIKDSGTENIKNRMLKCMKKAYAKYNKEEAYKEIALEIKGRIKRFALKDIFYIQSSDAPHASLIHVDRGVASVPFTLTSIEEQLDDKFYRCHRSYIVNMQHIIDIDTINHIIQLENGAVCPISKRHLKEARKRYDEFSRI